MFILDGPTWISAYGNWLSPKKKWFPDGLGPLADYIHQKGMLFGAYFETEGGRDGNTSFIWDGGALAGLWKESKVYQEHPEWFDNMNLNLGPMMMWAFFYLNIIGWVYVMFKYVFSPAKK